jgi:hypothetical protein
MPAQRDEKRTKELTEIKLLGEMVEHQLSNIVAELESIVEWQANAIGDEVNIGYHNGRQEE